jgi:hypothetical protein
MIYAAPEGCDRDAAFAVCLKAYPDTNLSMCAMSFSQAVEL